MRNLAIGAVLTVALVAPVRPAAAQSFTVLHAFASREQVPRGLLRTADGSFLGVTAKGGANGRGSVFRVSPAGALSTLHSFSGPDGAEPSAALAPATDGTFWGTTAFGGANGLGTVFRITPQGFLTTVHSLAFPDGAEPRGSVTQATDGRFYGTTYSGGAYGYGSVFRVTTAGVFEALHAFNAADGSNPRGGLVQGADGNLYGTTSFGGAGFFTAGTVFRMTPDGALTTLRSFSLDSDGTNPSAGLVAGSDGNFYGTTTLNGAGGYGDAFRITPAGVLTVLHHFVAATQSCLAGLVLAADGNFYGTTSREEGTSGSVIGTVFRLTPAGAFTVLSTFTADAGALPETGVVEGAGGDLFGSTRGSGADGAGSVFKVAASGGAATTIVFFPGSDAAGPRAGVVRGSDGNYYGTTSEGGAGNRGTVFGMSPAGLLTMRHAFSGSEGSNPYGGLVEGADGSFYGTAAHGGLGGYGTVFRSSPAGAMTTLHAFSVVDGAFPYAGLTIGTDGNFYGTTSSGGDHASGTAFRVTPAGSFATLHSFMGTDGAYPYADLLLGHDGDFFGTTYDGGSYAGTVFRMTPDGTVTTLHAFGAAFGVSDGRYPVGGLVQDADANLYGTTSDWGATTSHSGTVFKLTPGGVLTTLHSFIGFGGMSPRASLVLATDGNLYGTTVIGGAGLLGTLFRISPAGVFTLLWSFSGTDGANPLSPLMQGPDGHFYGTTRAAGPLGGGVVFRLTLGAGPAPTVTGVSPAGGNVAGGTVVTISGTDFQPGATVTFGGSPATGVTFSSATTLHALTPAHQEGVVSVAVTNPDLQVGGLASAFTYWTGSAPTSLFLLAPCRVLDTRSPATGAPSLAPNATRTFVIAGVCGIPADAVAVAANLTVVSRGAGFFAVFPGNGVYPGTSSLTFGAGQTRAANAILGLATDGTGAIAVLNGSTGANDLVLDVSGFFRSP